MISWVRKPNRGDDEDGDPPPIGSGKLTSLEFVKELVAHGADVNLQPKTGRAGTRHPDRARRDAVPGGGLHRGRCRSCGLLVELGADPLLPNADGSTPLAGRGRRRRRRPGGSGRHRARGAGGRRSCC